jgi:hypothetical protein
MTPREANLRERGLAGTDAIAMLASIFGIAVNVGFYVAEPNPISAGAGAFCLGMLLMNVVIANGR